MYLFICLGLGITCISFSYTTQKRTQVQKKKTSVNKSTINKTSCHPLGQPWRKNHKPKPSWRLPNVIFSSFIYLYKAVKQKAEKMREGKNSSFRTKATYIPCAVPSLAPSPTSAAASRNACGVLTHWGSASCFMVPETTASEQVVTVNSRS